MTLAIAVVIILIVAVVATRFENNSVSASYFSPGDTRVIGPSSTFCESTTLNNPTSTVSATVYLLQNKPVLSAKNNFTVTNQFFTILNTEYQYWSFYLYPGSTYTLSSCLVSGSVNYYIIKGKSNFDSWVNSPHSSYYSYQLYSNLCGGTNKTDGQTFNSEDEYYFVFYNEFYTPVNVAVTLTFNRIEYAPQPGSVMDSCTALPSSSCTMAIPYNSDYWFLVETTPPSDGQWDANINVGTSCNARVWVYAVIVLAPLIGVVVIVASTIAVCCCIKKMSGYQSLPTTTTTTTQQGPPSPPKQYDQPPSYTASSAPPPYQ